MIPRNWALTASSEFLAQTYFGFMVLLRRRPVSASAKMSAALMSISSHCAEALRPSSAGARLSHSRARHGGLRQAELNLQPDVQSLNLAKRMENAFGAYVARRSSTRFAASTRGQPRAHAPHDRVFVDIRGFTRRQSINPKQFWPY